MEENMKTPTLREKVKKYEELLHLLQMYAEVCMDRENTGKLISNICSWSYAHRCGNGEYSDREQQQIINRAFYKLTEV